MISQSKANSAPSAARSMVNLISLIVGSGEQLDHPVGVVAVGERIVNGGGRGPPIAGGGGGDRWGFPPPLLV